MPARSMTRLISWLATVSAGLALASQAAADPVFPPGMRIGLEPPPGLALSTQFPGFLDSDHKVAITMLDLPGRAYVELEHSLFSANSPALTVEKREMFSFNSGIGYLITGHGISDGVDVHKWLLLAYVANDKVGQLITLVTAQVPDAALATYPDKAIRAALASVTFRPTPVDERLKLLPFKLDALAGFRVLQIIPNGVIITDGPADDLTKQPYMIVGIGRGSPNEVNARSLFARDLLAGAPLSDLTMTSSEPMRIGGFPGHEIRASAKGLDGAPLSVVQWVRFGPGVFLRIVGVARKEQWDQEFTQFRTVRDGVEIR
jgi:hypothetical protein